VQASYNGSGQSTRRNPEFVARAIARYRIAQAYQRGEYCRGRQSEPREAPGEGWCICCSADPDSQSKLDPGSSLGGERKLVEDMVKRSPRKMPEVGRQQGSRPVRLHDRESDAVLGEEPGHLVARWSARQCSDSRRQTSLEVTAGRRNEDAPAWVERMSKAGYVAGHAACFTRARDDQDCRLHQVRLPEIARRQESLVRSPKLGSRASRLTLTSVPGGVAHAGCGYPDSPVCGLRRLGGRKCGFWLPAEQASSEVI
jgi:hypothetical protein